MSDTSNNQTLFAASILNAAMHGALAEMDDYFQDTIYTNKSKENHQHKNKSD